LFCSQTFDHNSCVVLNVWVYFAGYQTICKTVYCME
jgi:hypothetical protein